MERGVQLFDLLLHLDLRGPDTVGAALHLEVFLDPEESFVPLHYAAVIMVVLMAVGALTFGLYVVLSNWSDYKEILTPRAPQIPKRRGAPRQN